MCWHHSSGKMVQHWNMTVLKQEKGTLWFIKIKIEHKVLPSSALEISSIPASASVQRQYCEPGLIKMIIATSTLAPDRTSTVRTPLELVPL